MSDKLNQEALEFIARVESEANSEGYRKGYADGYEKHKAETEGATDAGQPTTEPIQEPTGPEVPSPADDPAEDPVNEGYSREKVITELLAIKGGKSCAFGIVDTSGNVHADAAEWILNGRPEVLGIGYTDGTIHICLLPKKAGTAPFGFSGAMVPGVYHTKAQWKKDSKPGKPSAYEDYSGAANSDALVKAQDEAEAMAAGISAAALAAAQNTAVFKAHSLVSARGKRGYLPPCGEMRIYCANHKKVDPLLTAVGGDKLRTRTGNANEGFWTSTCINETQAWIAMFSDSNSQPAQRQKLTNFNVRAFVEL